MKTAARLNRTGNRQCIVAFDEPFPVIRLGVAEHMLQVWSQLKIRLDLAGAVCAFGEQACHQRFATRQPGFGSDDFLQRWGTSRQGGADSGIEPQQWKSGLWFLKQCSRFD